MHPFALPARLARAGLLTYGRALFHKGVGQTLASVAASESPPQPHDAPPGSEITLATRYTLDIPLSTDRPRLCILGTGWAAARLLRDIDPKSFDLTVSSAAACYIAFAHSVLYCLCAQLHQAWWCVCMQDGLWPPAQAFRKLEHLCACIMSGIYSIHAAAHFACSASARATTWSSRLCWPALRWVRWSSGRLRSLCETFRARWRGPRTQ